MTIGKVLDRLEFLKSTLLEDGRIDKTEAEVLLDWIRPYCDARIQKFCDLEQQLKSALEDGEISDSESAELSQALDKVESRLIVERNVEWMLTSLVVGFLVLAIAAAF